MILSSVARGFEVNLTLRPIAPGRVFLTEAKEGQGSSQR